MDGGYGLYARAKRQWATLLFGSQAAQWVSREEWHPEQCGRWLDDGSYELQIPFVGETEIVMDILRHGNQVRVMAPDRLANRVSDQLETAAMQYRA